MLLQYKIQGKAQEVVSSLPLADSLQYDIVKEAMLRAYKLVREAYQQRFRGHRKSPSLTNVAFAREKGTLFDRWCSACKVTDYAVLRELVLVEEFKKRLHDRLVVYLNEQKVTSLSATAVSGPVRPRSPPSPSTQVGCTTTSVKEEHESFYCPKRGHIIANCVSLKRKETSHSASSEHQPKGLGLIQGIPSGTCPAPRLRLDLCFQSFTFHGVVSLPENPEEARSI